MTVCSIQYSRDIVPGVVMLLRSADQNVIPYHYAHQYFSGSSQDKGIYSSQVEAIPAASASMPVASAPLQDNAVTHPDDGRTQTLVIAFVYHARDHLNEGWTFAQMQEQLKDPTCSIETLRPPFNPRGGGSLPSVGKSASLDCDLPDFSIEEMHRQIIKFIVADDQCCLVFRILSAALPLAV
ncbi:hypothetical protein BD769DRAFT_1388148 [Suillus cothurnatus]|nr:hypothetical protein BD769DRAFT_1388148 [Suillus cothurnatus]